MDGWGVLSDDAYLAKKLKFAAMQDEAAKRRALKFYTYYPDEGPLRRELYAKHMEFFALGKTFNERMAMMANRVGKTESGAFEVTCHLTGLYPPWWRGRTFSRPTEWWCCGTTSETTRDVVQAKLLGPWNNSAEPGMVPPHLIIATTPRPHGLRGSIESAYIRHVSGGRSLVSFKTYEQGRKSFEGTSKDGIWDDEEPPLDVYTEQLYRTLTTKGIVLITFTPLQGMSEVVLSYLEPQNDEARAHKTYVQAGWDDVPHLDADAKRTILATTPQYQIAARTKGEPSLGSGAIYPISEADITIDSFWIPDTWPKAYALDVGWNRTAALFGAREVGTGIYHFYDEHYRSMGEPASHVQAIKARGGDWMTGLIDPAARGRSQVDGRQLIAMYRDLGLHLEEADHAVEAGIQDVWMHLIEGKLVVHRKCENWLREFRKYHRDEKGNIVKEGDHLMDDSRYLMKGRDRMRPKPRETVDADRRGPASRGRGWMAG